MGVFTSTKQFRLGLNLTNPWWLSGASIDLDLDNGRYYDSSLTALKRSLATVTDYLSCTRASTGHAKTSAGTLTQFGNNVLRITDLGLLVEDARTNGCAQSEDFTNSSPWNTVLNLTFSANAATAPNGQATADKLIPTVTSGEHAVAGGNSGDTGVVTASCYFKAAGYNFACLSISVGGGGTQLAVVVNLLTGTTEQVTLAGSPTSTSVSSELLGNGWVRAAVTMNCTSGPSIGVQVYNNTRANGGNNFAGDASSGIYAWGAQIEAGAFASSYIPTTTTSATRAADNITIAGSLGTLLTAATTSFVTQLNGMPAGVALDIIRDISTSADILRTNSLGNYQSAKAASTLSTANASNSPLRDKCGLSWDGGGRSVVLNNGAVATSADAMSSLAGDTLCLGSSAGAGSAISGYCERLTVWNSRLADATLQALTAP